ncbi:MAG: LamG-like jellyroll fold domain-containing protein [Bacteroidota bacterium]
MKKNYHKFRMLLFIFLLMLPFFLTSQSLQYLHFDKIDDYVLLDGAGQYVTGTNEISMTGWFYCDQLAYGQGYMGFRIGSGDGEFYLIQLSNGVMECRLQTTTGLHQFVSPANTAVEQVWQHFAWVYDGSDIILYVDGVMVGSSTASGTFTSSTVPFGIGISNFPGYNFVFGGGIDEVSVWDKGLTQTEIQDIINNELTGTENNLQLYYKFNQGVPGGNNTSITQLISEIGSGARDADLFNFTLMGDTSNFMGTVLNAQFTASDTVICLNESVTFTDQSAGSITSWSWTFEGGSPGSSTQQNPVVAYNSTGIYDVQLVVSDGVVFDTLTKEDCIEVLITPGQANTPDGPILTCGGMEYEYSTDSVAYATSYEWVVDPTTAGSFSGTGSTATYTASSTYSGSYTVKVRATNVCGNGGWSSELQCTLVEVPAIFSLEGEGAYCQGTSGAELSLSGSEVDVDYELYLDDVPTGNIVGGTGSAITFSPVTDEGIYACYANRSICDVLMIGQVWVHMINVPEQGTIPQGLTELCNDTTTTYLTEEIGDADTVIWTLVPAEAGILTPDGLETTVDWDSTFSGMAFLSVHGENDCGSGLESDSLEITVWATPLPEISGLVEVCEEDEATYETADNPGNSYYWEVEGGEIIDGAGTHLITVLWGAPGQGIVGLTEETPDGCNTTTDDYEVTINECTSIYEISHSDIRIYPNPADERVNIKSKTNMKSIVIYNSNGEHITTLYPQSRHFDFNSSSLRNGLYLFKIETITGIVTKRIMID